MMNCLMHPLIYAFAGCFFIYQIQRYQIKKHKFMKELILNFLPKLNIQEFKKQEKYYGVFVRLCFQYIGTHCSFETKESILKESTDVASKK